MVPFAHVLRRTENNFFAEAVDTERYNRFFTVWPHSDFAVVYPERLPLKEAILNYDGIPVGSREELQRVAKSASRWASVQMGFRAFASPLKAHGAALAGKVQTSRGDIAYWFECLPCVVTRTLGGMRCIFVSY